LGKKGSGKVSLKQKIDKLETFSFWDIQKILDGRTFVCNSKDKNLSDVKLIKKHDVVALLGEASKQIQDDVKTLSDLLEDISAPNEVWRLFRKIEDDLSVLGGDATK
jgi:rubrerythrin